MKKLMGILAAALIAGGCIGYKCDFGDVEVKSDAGVAQIESSWKSKSAGLADYAIRTVCVSAAGTEPVHVTKLTLAEFPVAVLDKVEVIGTVPGSPVALDDDTICGVEQPSFKAEKVKTVGDSGVVKLVLDCDLTLKPGEKPLEFRVMCGRFPKEQRRRAFNDYLEAERAAPSRTFLHYNGWYDFGTEPTEAGMLEIIKSYAEETAKRGITMDGYVLDDGWDEQKVAAWRPTPKKFPNGFTTMTKLAEENGSAFGIWISPLGGYFGVPERIESAKREGGLPADATAFDLAYPEYYNWFKGRCTDLIVKDHSRYFKWDKAGEGVSMHFMKLCELARELRAIEPKLMINVTVGTWPSPFWLNHIDCTWRNGTADVFWYGDAGNERDKWLTFRDTELYRCFVKKSPLYPLNSVMHHGIVLGTKYQGATNAKAGNDMKREIRSYFALGPNMQEIYVDPKLVGPDFWDQLAESVKWSKRHEKALVDIHWVKGEPLVGDKLGAYMLAAWKDGDGTIYLRNASAEEKSLTFTLSEAFELKTLVAGDARYTVKGAYADDGVTPLTVEVTDPLTYTLAPLQVLVLEAKAEAPRSEMSISPEWDSKWNSF